MGKPVPLAQSKRNLSNAQRETKAEAESLILTNATTPKPTSQLTATEKKLFNKFKKQNDYLTEADSVGLTQLAIYYARWDKLQQASRHMDVLDHELGQIEKRMLALDKQINKLLMDLGMSLTARFKLTSEVAKIMLEERKLQQMEGPKQINPLLELLGDDDE